MGRILRRHELCRAHFELTFEVEGFPAAVPGQFLQVLCRPPFDDRVGVRFPNNNQTGTDSRSGCEDPGSVLRRPFSIAGVRRNRTCAEVDLLARVVGAGTLYLASLVPGDMLDVMGPMGRGFSMPKPRARALLVAGGVGWAPIGWLGERLSTAGVTCDAICAAATRDLLPVSIIKEPSPDGENTLCVDELARVGIRTMVTTDDGSCGLQGLATDGMKRYLAMCDDSPSLTVYACGPSAMLRAVASMCGDSGIRCELAMERMMGCGMGTCQSCVIRLADDSSAEGWRYGLCCADGPVFRGDQVVWG